MTSRWAIDAVDCDPALLLSAAAEARTIRLLPDMDEVKPFVIVSAGR